MLVAPVLRSACQLFDRPSLLFARRSLVAWAAVNPRRPLTIPSLVTERVALCCLPFEPACPYCLTHWRKELLRMSKKKVVLTEEQRRRNAEILARLEEERVRLVEETRALQQQERRRPGRKRKKKPMEELVVAAAD